MILLDVKCFPDKRFSYVSTILEVPPKHAYELYVFPHIRFTRKTPSHFLSSFFRFIHTNFQFNSLGNYYNTYPFLDGRTEPVNNRLRNSSLSARPIDGSFPVPQFFCYSSLGAFENLRKATACFLIPSPFHSARMERSSRWSHFSDIFNWRFFTKTWRGNPSWLKIDQK